MNPALPSFILGYHGRDASLADKVFAGSTSLKPSSNDYDWLGDGIYFWEQDPRRAHDFAVEMAKRPHPSGQKIRKPAVVGAVINLATCLNLLDRHFIEMVKRAHDDLVTFTKAADLELPENTGGTDLVDRKLDCAVLRMLHQTREGEGLPAFDTVRAAFFEGQPLYEKAGFAAKNHIQVCVRNHACIHGYFRPLDDQGKPVRFN